MSAGVSDRMTAAPGQAAPARPRKSTRSVAVRTAVIVVLVAAPPLIFSGYWLFVAAQVLAFGIATLGLEILYGRTGQLSLAHASFMGVGAYTGYVLSQHGYGVPAQLGAVLVVALVTGAIVAVPTLRLSGLRLALVTLAVGELFAWLLTNTTGLTGGTQGAAVAPVVIGSLDSSVPLYAYLIALVPAALATLLAVHLGRTQLGRRMLLVRDSETAARSVGVAIARTKIIAFLLSAVFAGFAGWLYSVVAGFISPADFNLFASVYLFVAVILGGAGSVVGAWLGAAYVVFMPQLFTLMGQPNLYPLIGGAILAVVALLIPDGMVGLARRLLTRAQRRRVTATEVAA
ncbi:MAG: inner-rane translocator [Blastococcus sp.]|jgi:branched-chain amino acid transport system permease protein|nr:inner-rane translocator [Blastococcus sp.]